ncbi:MAG: HAD hydrolase-like protein [Eubacteriales bacterium]|nr:HAD hydrolase-like protein [Eubacteriales bacterium]
MKKYEIAVFDVDGTLLDTTEGVLASVKYTINKMGFKPLSEDVLKTFIGPPIQDSFAKAYNLEGSILQEIATCFRNRYKDYELLKAVPYEGIYDVFDELSDRGVKLAVATYKRQDYAEAILKHFGFDRYTNILYGADHENKLKKVDIIEKCMIDLGVTDYSNAVMVGDSSHDAIGAEKIGMDFIGVTYGFDFRTPEDVAKFNSIGVATKPIELLDIILR